MVPLVMMMGSQNQYAIKSCFDGALAIFLSILRFDYIYSQRKTNNGSSRNKAEIKQ